MAEKKRRVLMIDDDTALTELVAEFFQSQGIELHEAADAEQGWTMLARVAPDLVILDVMLPGKNGFDLCKELRRTSDVPIIMLTARGGINDRVLGLELGADDYLSKPFEPRELLARVQAILRRGRQSAEPRRLLFEDLEIDLASRTASLAGAPIGLTTAEFELLTLFVSRPNETLSRDGISQRLRGTELEALSRSIDIVMSRLRQKLGDDPKAPRFFKTIWGTGYMFIGKRNVD